MDNNVIFFSYSRDDSEFVLNLAKELRESGATIWLDQLDIRPGSRWDTSIENALESSKILLVVLSKTAVESNNVLDEVSFALEEKKTVVPLLLEECDIPFRLRRLQFADFTGDRQKGMDTLCQALNLDKKVAEKLCDQSTMAPPPEKPKQAPKAPKPVIDQTNEPDTIAKPVKKKGKSKLIIGIVAVIIIGYFVISLFDDDDTDDPTELMEDSSALSDAADWDRIINSENPDDFTAHEASYDDCIHTEDITQMVSFLQLKVDEKVQWDKATNSGDLMEYLTYMMQYQQAGTYYEDALGVVSAQFVNSGYVQYSESNGYQYFHVFGDPNIVTPRVGDLITAQAERNLHVGALGTADYDLINHVSSVNEPFLVTEVEQIGDAIWIKVSF